MTFDAMTRAMARMPCSLVHPLLRVPEPNTLPHPHTTHTRLLVGGALERLVFVCEIELILSLWAVDQVTKLPVLYCGLEPCKWWARTSWRVKQ